MYSYGSSGRLGIGRRGGHGGRDYRPPPDKKKDRNELPPPLKDCGCLIELNVPEYEQTATGGQQQPGVVLPNRQQQQPAARRHSIFGGRQKVAECESFVRSSFLVHLIVPGKKQKGPLGIVGKSIRQVLPATEWLLRRFHRNAAAEQNKRNNGDDNTDANDNRNTTAAAPATATIQLRGRVFLDIKKDIRDAIEGTFQSCNGNNTNALASNTNNNNKNNNNFETPRLQQPYWLFRSERWCVLVCNVLEIVEDNNDNIDDNNNTNSDNNDNNSSNTNNNDNGDATSSSGGGILEQELRFLETCFDNAQFRLGRNATNQLDLLLDVVREEDPKRKQQRERQHGGGRGERQRQRAGAGGNVVPNTAAAAAAAATTNTTTTATKTTTRTTAFAVGNPQQTKLLFDEISNAMNHA